MGVETIAAIGIPAAIALFSELTSDKGGADAGVATANADKLRLMKQAQDQLSQYRPQLAGAEKAAMNDTLSSYQGANDALATMYGGGKAGGGPMGKLPDPSVLGGRSAGQLLGGSGGVGDHGNLISPDRSGAYPRPGGIDSLAGALFGGSGTGDKGNLVGPTPSPGTGAGFRAGAGAPLVSDPGGMAGYRAGASAPPVRGNGPPMGTPTRGLPDPMQIIGRQFKS